MVPLDFHKKKVLYYICLPFQETLKLIKGKMQFYRDALLRTSVNMGKGDIMIWEIWESGIYRYGRRSHTTNTYVMDKRNNAYLENNFNTASFAKLTQQL